ncbi:MAG: hypothetical protein ACRCYU_22025 [Nocardioides sp.]
MESYGTEDDQWFFGREDDVGALCDEVSAAASVGEWVWLTGASGSGKSSILHAGLIPAVHAGRVEGLVGIAVVNMTPGPHPVAAFNEQLVGLPPLTADGSSGYLVVVDQFEELFTQSDPDEALEFLGLLKMQQASVPAPRSSRPRITAVVAGLRADFYATAIERGLIKGVQERQVVVGAMGTEQLRLVIESPARRAGFDVEAGFADVVIADVVAGDPEQPSSLPFLSHALLATWERSRRSRLTVADYLATGGIAAAVSRSAEQTFGRLSPGQQVSAERVFRRMVRVSEESADTRRKVSYEELGLRRDATAAGASNTSGEVTAVLEAFGAARMVTMDRDHAEITHEALLAAWPRLREWIDADREGLLIHRQLTRDASAWCKAEDDPGMLYRGGRLSRAEDWLGDESRAGELNDIEAEFLRESLADRDRQNSAAERRVRRIRVTAAGFAALALLAAGSTMFAARLRQSAAEERDAATSGRLAFAADRVRPKDASLAASFATIAYRRAPTTEAASALLSLSGTDVPARWHAPRGVVQTVASSPSGELVAAAGETGMVRLWRRNKEGVLSRVADIDASPGAYVFALAFSPDGQTLAAGGMDRRVHLWNVEDPSKPTALSSAPEGLTGPSNTIYGLTFSPDGKRLAAGAARADKSTDSMVYVWDLATASIQPSTRLTGPTEFVQAVAFSPDSRQLAAASLDSKVYRWVLDPSGTRFRSLPPYLAVGELDAVAFSHDGRTLATGSRDGKVYLWEPTGVRSDQEPPRRELAGPATWVNSIVFSPDDRALIGASSDSQTWTWDLETGQPRHTWRHPSPVTSVAYLDEETVVTASLDSTIRTWATGSPHTKGLPGIVYQLSSSRDGDTVIAAGVDAFGANPWDFTLWDTTQSRTPRLRGAGVSPVADAERQGSGTAALWPNRDLVASGMKDGKIYFWNIESSEPQIVGVPLETGPERVGWIAISPDGNVLAQTNSDDDRVYLWDVSDITKPSRLITLSTTDKNLLQSIEFSPDGRLFTAAGTDNQVHLWDVTDPKSPAKIRFRNDTVETDLYSAAFSPDSKMIAAGGGGNRVFLWEATNPDRPRYAGSATSGVLNNINSVAFSPDGKQIATGNEDATVRLFDITKRGAPVETAAIDAGGVVKAVTYSRDGSSVLTSGEGEIHAFQLNPKKLANNLCEKIGDPMSKTEWNQYLRDEPYADPCA